MTSITHDIPEVDPADIERRAYIDGLRRVADFLDAHPDIPVDGGERFSFFIGWRFDDKPAAMAAAVRSLATQGKVTKDYGDGSSDYVHAEVRIGPHAVGVMTHRDAVCEKVIVGTETVEVPDPDALAAVPTVTVEQDRYEWRCHPLLSGQAVTA